jgi:pSer/pThr/pTyr-binding forkhead associated (FHA) protein
MCNALLAVPTTLTADMSRTISDMAVPLPPADTVQLARRDVSSLGINMLAFYVKDVDNPIIYDVTTQVILGRFIPDSPTQPQIDLNPYGAVEKGVSRMHALIRRSPKGLTVQDMASSNGTWLAGSRLKPFLPTPLKSGAKLQLGQLLIDVRFRGQE